ncbi:gamma carbonic anhydrase family protein [Streptomyces sp. NBC_01498]|uniref:gamma carbonic anhydrase family protein n=1 Tax=Streptomyces sp. NBC_01498 TaxID=2975870 RepID=UPI002E7B180B|nr:gamma carbonic anhydrase family protein [Streptomyces sp. NBC_01498]WTL28061.1 gamma carbonic anhydrase family protein [Streptomyces sp. NBC_01498]
MTDRALVAAVGGKEPVVHPAAFVAPTAVVLGEVTLAAGASVWYHTVLRADGGPVVVGADSNIQDNCTVHVDPGRPVTIGERVSVGHNAVLHGCTVEDDVLVGMGATVLNGAHIGAGSLVAAQALVPEGMRVPPGSLVAGVPARVKRELTEEEIEGIRLNAAVYLDLAERHRSVRGSEPGSSPGSVPGSERGSVPGSVPGSVGANDRPAG